MGPLNVNLSYLQKINALVVVHKYKNDFNNKENREITFETKRNLITNSSEFYNLSYSILMIV